MLHSIALAKITGKYRCNRLNSQDDCKSLFESYSINSSVGAETINKHYQKNEPFSETLRKSREHVNNLQAKILAENPHLRKNK